MAKTKKEKIVLMQSYDAKIKAAKGFVVVKPLKLTPNETNDFRKEIFDSKAELNIVKNSIFKLALKSNKLPEISDLDNGEHAILFFQDDLVTPNKSLKKLIDSTKNKEGISKITIVSGVLDGQLLTIEQVNELADMPTIQGSIGLILGVLDNALSSIVNVLEDPVKSYLSIIDQSFKA